MEGGRAKSILRARDGCLLWGGAGNGQRASPMNGAAFGVEAGMELTRLPSTQASKFAPRTSDILGRGRQRAGK